MTANALAKIALQIKMYTNDVLPVPLATRLGKSMQIVLERGSIGKPLTF